MFNMIEIFKSKEDKIKNSKDNNNKYFLILKLNNKLKININIKVNIALLSPLTIVPKIISKKEIKKKIFETKFFFKNLFRINKEKIPKVDKYEPAINSSPKKPENLSQSSGSYLPL